MGHDYKVIAVLGDSVTDGYYDTRGIGWVGRLEEKLHGEKPLAYGFNNFAVSGDRICDVWHRLGGMLMKREANILFLAVGINDTYRYGSRDAPPSMSLELRRYYWHKTLDLAKKLVPEVYVFGLLPVDEKKVPARTDDFGVQMYYRNDDIRAYSDEIRNWCAGLGVNFISFHDKMMEAGVEKYMDDDVHPNSEGHALLAGWAFDTLKDKI